MAPFLKAGLNLFTKSFYLEKFNPLLLYFFPERHAWHLGVNCHRLGLDRK